MKLKDIRRSIVENVEKLRPHLANYIAGLIAKPYKEYISENGLALKQYFSAKSPTGSSRLEQFQAEIINYYGDQDITISPYSFGGLVAISMHGNNEYRVIDSSAEMPVFESLSAEGSDIVSNGIRSLMLKYEQYIEAKNLPSSQVESLIRIIDYKKGPDLDTLVNLVFNADPVLNRDVERGLQPAQQNSPFAKIIARWAYDPSQLSNIRLPQEKEILWEQFRRYNIAQSKGLRLDLNNVEHYDDFVDALRPYMRDLEDVDRYELAGLKMLTRFGDYKIYILDKWEPEVNQPDLHKLIADSGWCVRYKRNWESYQPPFYMVVKGSKKLVLIHIRTGEFKNVYNQIYKEDDGELIFTNFIQSSAQIFKEILSNGVKFISPANPTIGQLKGDFGIFLKNDKIINLLMALAADPRIGLDLNEKALENASLTDIVEYIESKGYTKDISKMKPSLARLVKNAVVLYYRDTASLNEQFGLTLSAPDMDLMEALKVQPFQKWTDYYDLAIAGGQNLPLSMKYNAFFEPRHRVPYYASIGESILSRIYQNIYDDRNLTSEVASFKRRLLRYGYEKDKDDPEVIKMRLDVEKKLADDAPLGLLAFVIIFGVVDKQRLRKILETIPKWIKGGYPKKTVRQIVDAVQAATGVSAEVHQSTIDRLLEALYDEEPNEVIAELEEKLLSESLPLAVMYAKEHKGPWGMLQAALLKSGDIKLIEKYKTEVLYGEEYE